MKTYIVVPLSPIFHQMTLDEFLSSDNSYKPIVNMNISNTKTYEVNFVTDNFRSKVDTGLLINRLRKFNEDYQALRDVPREQLYHSFKIPKKSGGWRTIDEPLPELMNALRVLKMIFEDDFHALYHTSAFAYVKKRCTVDAVKRHQANESKWFAKFDLHDFFGSTTLDFVLQQFSMVFPFSEVMQYSQGKEELSKALELAFLNGGLPQGTPISPLITNVMMIPIDYKLYNTFRAFKPKACDGKTQKFVYTRYADDFIVSCRYDFDVKEIQSFMLSVLEEFKAPFSLNVKKTRYGSSSGRNWNLGVMLNKDNKITVGNAKKKNFEHSLYNYLKDKKNGVVWEVGDIMVTLGLYSYYRSVEPESIDGIIDHFNKKENVNIIKLMRADLN